MFLGVNPFAGLNMEDEHVEKAARYGYMAKERGYAPAGFKRRSLESTMERYRQKGK